MSDRFYLIKTNKFSYLVKAIDGEYHALSDNGYFDGEYRSYEIIAHDYILNGVRTAWKNAGDCIGRIIMVPIRNNPFIIRPVKRVDDEVSELPLGWVFK